MANVFNSLAFYIINSIFAFSLVFFSAPVKSEGSAITQTKLSPYVKFKSINVGDTRWTTGFWADKFKVAESTMVPHMGGILTGDVGHALDNFKVAAGLQEGNHVDWPWHDGDFYKWMESATYIYAVNQDPKILDYLDDYIAIIAKAQQPNGYLSTYNTIKKKAPWQERNHHELYNSGHLITSAIIHKRITGQNNFFNIAIKNADYLYDLFQPRPEKLAYFGFNPSQIMALVELYRETKDKRYLELAGIFIDMKGATKVSFTEPTVLPFHVGDMVQERTPFREENNAVGHAVLAMYLYAGAADVYAETGEQALLDALKRLWSSANERKMFVHGGLGQIDHGATNPFDSVHEGFIHDYMMPNSRSYSETCANVANAMFNWRMLGLLGEAKFADNMELVLYNSALSGISLDGTKYFYTNPLRKVDGVIDYNSVPNESAERKGYFRCFCCPPNLVRTIAKLSGWAYSLTKNGLAVNLYGGNELDTYLMDGSKLKLVQNTKYPWDGKIEIEIKEAKKSAFEILLRIPNWAENSTLLINDKKIKAKVTTGQYVTLKRNWSIGDKITLNLPMNINLVEGDPRIEEVRNQVAIQRGPIVYALETTDLPKNTDILDAYLSSDVKLTPVYKAELLGGITAIEGNILLRKHQGEGMYRHVDKLSFSPFKTQFIPYYSWSNRGDAEMSVFLPVLWKVPSP